MDKFRVPSKRLLKRRVDLKASGGVAPSDISQAKLTTIKLRRNI